MQERGAEPVSKIRRSPRGRAIQYPWIDLDIVKRGRLTRAEHNARIIRNNEMRAEHQRQNAAYWSTVQAEQEAGERKNRENRAQKADAREVGMQVPIEARARPGGRKNGHGGDFSARGIPRRVPQSRPCHRGRFVYLHLPAVS